MPGGMFWLLLFAVLGAACVAAFALLGCRIARFSFVRRLAGNRRWLARACGMVLLAVCGGALWLAIGALNAAICLLYTLAIWLLCDLAAWAVRRARGGKAQSAGNGSVQNDAVQNDAAQNTAPNDAVQSGARVPANAASAAASLEATGAPQRESVQPGGDAIVGAKPYWAGVAAIVLSAAVLGASWHLAHDVVQTNYALSGNVVVDGALAQGPADGDAALASSGLRILALSDAHVGATFNGERFAEYVERMNAQQPDVVVVVGDFVDDGTSMQDMQAACAALGSIEAPLGVYYVYGNHDAGFGRNLVADALHASAPNAAGASNAPAQPAVTLESELRRNGVRILVDEAVNLAGNVWLIGRQDARVGSRASMAQLVAGREDDYVIVLDHQPTDFAAQVAAGANLVISGHTHGGQMFPINAFIWAGGFNDALYGHERRGGTDFIVSSGIGDWNLKFRNFCRAEYVVVDVA